MIHLPESLRAWPGAEFAPVLKRELERLSPEALPLQQGLSSTSYALGDAFSVMVIGAREDAGAIKAKVGVFYAGITSGCNCAGDPTPVEPQSEYCEIELAIDKATGQAAAALV